MSLLSFAYSRMFPVNHRHRPLRKKIGLMRSFLSRHPMWVAWQVTYRCNLKCSFCNYWQSPSKPEDELTVEQFRQGSRNLSRMGASLVSLAGGEPLVRNDIVDIVAAIGDYHFPFITTNGWNADEHLAREIFAAGCWGVSISLDYAAADLHDGQRGREGAYERAVQAIETFSRARKHAWQRCNVMCVLVDDNLSQIEPLLKLAARHDAYFMVQPYSNLKTGESSYKHQGRASEHLLELKRRYPNFLSNPSFLARFDEFLERGEVPGCLAGRYFFNVDERGDVAICVEKRGDILGNIVTTPARALVNHLKQAGRANSCHRCWYNCRGEIESLASVRGMMASLPTYLYNRGRPSHQPDWASKNDGADKG